MSAYRNTMRRISVLAVAFVALVAIMPLGVAIAGALAAYGVVRREPRHVVSAVTVAGLAGLVTQHVGALIVMPVATLTLGLIVGGAILRGNGYWRIVAYATALLFVVTAALLFGMRDVASSAASDLAVGEADAAGYSEFTRNALAAFEWWFEHWVETAIGVAFVDALVIGVLVTALTAAALRRSESEVQVSGSFRKMHVPDGVVWLVIATAALWYADTLWPADWMRIASWNAALALAGLYWLNGLSIAAYAVAAFRPGPFMLGALVLSAVLLNLLPFLCIPGQFDTWADFRKKMDDVLRARQLRKESRDDSA